MSDVGFQVAWDVTRGQPGAAGIVSLYSGGALGASFRPDGPYTTGDSAPVRAAVDHFLPLLDEVWPGASAHYAGEATGATPLAIPTCLAVTPQAALGQLTTFGGYEGVRQGRIHFAGRTAAHREFPGFMEGAAEAGIRAAEEILADLERGRADGK